MANGIDPHPGYRGVGKKMHELVDRYFADAMPLADLSTDEIFEYVERIPYVMDRDVWSENMEVVCRPARFDELSGLDCKKKAILIACWAQCRGLGYRFWAIDDTGRGVSHVFAEIEEAPGYWVSMDCTIPGLFKPGSAMPNVRSAEMI